MSYTKFGIAKGSDDRMSRISVMSGFTYSALLTVWHILNKRDCKALAIVTGVAFAVFYIFFTGIITFSSIPIPEEIPVPYLHVITNGPIGKFPWIVAYLTRYSVFSMNLEAMISTILISLLVGINSALMLYRFRITKKAQCDCASGAPPFFASIVPASFSVFACCGGGLLLTIFGAGFMSALMPYGNLFSIISIIGLTAAMFVSSHGINFTLRSVGKDLTKGSI